MGAVRRGQRCDNDDDDTAMILMSVMMMIMTVALLMSLCEFIVPASSYIPMIVGQ